MCDDMTGEVLEIDKDPSAAAGSDSVALSSRRARNDHKWNSLKDEIQGIYMNQNSTLQNTRRAIEEKHGFKASERKWKEKLKEWSFDKKISASNMSILVAKAEKRVREDGKDTVFHLGGSQITEKRIHQFKRRKTTKAIEPPPPESEIPKNITYHTPPRAPSEPLQPSENIRRLSFMPDECAPSTISLRHGPDYAFRLDEGNGKLPTVPEGFEHPSSEDGASSSATALCSTDSDHDRNHPGTCDVDVFDAIDHLSEKDSSVQTPGLESISAPSISDPLSVDESLAKLCKSLDTLCVDFQETFAFEIITPSPQDRISQKEAQLGTINGEELPQYAAEEEARGSLMIGDSDHRAISASQTHHATFETGSTSSSEYDLSIFQVSFESTAARSLSAAAALERGVKLWNQGSHTTAILNTLVVQEKLPCLEFCEDLAKVSRTLQKAGRVEEALLAVDLVYVGCSTHLGYSSKEAGRCLALKAKLLKEMKRYIESETTYGAAMLALRKSGDIKGLLKCQLGLGSLLKSRDREREALHLLLEALMEHFTLPKTSQERRSVIKLLHAIRSLHRNMDFSEDATEMEESISRLKSVQLRPVPEQKKRAHFVLYVELVRFGRQYSKRQMSKFVELCFRYPPPIVAGGSISPTTRIQLCLFYKDRCLYAKEEENVYQSRAHLNAALVNISSLMIDASVQRSEEYKSQLEELISDFEQIVSSLEPSPLSLVEDPNYPECLEYWQKARQACEALRTESWRVHEILGSIDISVHAQTRREQTTSISSGRSSMLSGGKFSISSGGSSRLSGSSSRYGVTYSAGSVSSLVSNSGLIVP